MSCDLGESKDDTDLAEGQHIVEPLGQKHDSGGVHSQVGPDFGADKGRDHMPVHCEQVAPTCCSQL